MKYLKLILFFSLVFLTAINISGCASITAPSDRQDICSIFRQKPSWYWTAEDVQKKWNLPMSTLMAIMYQESSFGQHAKPPRKKLLWIIPWKRPTSASGYSQAIEATWMKYKSDTHNYRASRNDFDDAADFIGWYALLISKNLGVPTSDTYSIYLAYHEGSGNYQRGTHKKKPWLIDVAKNVQRRAWIYQTQLRACQSSLPQKHWWNIF